MTVTDILEQAKKLSAQERKELAKLLIDMIDEPQIEDSSVQTGEHWGKSVGQLLDELGPIELKYPEIEDPVEWVKHLREQQRQQRLGDTE